MSTVAAAHTSTPSLRAWLLAAFAFTLGGVLTGAAYFSVGGIFALVSDLFALGMGITGLAVVVGLHAYVSAVTGARADVVRTVGLIAYVVTILGSAALVLFNLGVSVPGGVALGAQFLGMTAQGAWMLGFGLLAIRSRVFDRTTGSMLVLAGLGYLSFGAGAVVAPGSVAAMAGGFLGVVVYLVLVLRLRAAVRTP